MLNWLGGLLGERRTKPREAPPTEVAASTHAASTHASSALPFTTGKPEDAPDPNALCIAWMLDTAPARDVPIEPAELQVLARLDGLMKHDDATTRDMLTRVPAGIPRLLGVLRQDDLPVHTLNEHIAKDLLLTAEVLRLANSVHYRPRAQSVVTDLSQAITALGRSGVQQAVARVLLRPMFDVNAGALTSRSAPRLWEHAERKAALCATLASQNGIESFEGYLAGLAHNTGWSAVWRAAERVNPAMSLPCTLAFSQEVVWRRDRLYGKLIAALDITPTLTALGTEARSTALARVASPLGALVLAADVAATAAMLAAPVQ